MQQSTFVKPLLVALVAVTLLLGSSNVMRAAASEVDACTAYLEMVSGLSNLACTPGNLSAILVFVVPEQPQPVQRPGEDALAVGNNCQEGRCTPLANSARLVR